MPRVGLVSDTHGLVRPEVVAALRGVDRILHMGDVGGPEVLAKLESVAPVCAVRGNMDRGAWAAELPETLTLDLVGTRVHLVHDLAALDLDPAAAGIGVVLYGHSHRPHREERDGVLYVNPGAAGPRRFDLPVSIAFLAPGPH
ncbi:MAG: metallophosphoesterase family protein, partial [Planctomycetota bacterium]